MRKYTITWMQMSLRIFRLANRNDMSFSMVNGLWQVLAWVGFSMAVADDLDWK